MRTTTLGCVMLAMTTACGQNAVSAGSTTPPVTPSASTPAPGASSAPYAGSRPSDAAKNVVHPGPGVTRPRCYLGRPFGEHLAAQLKQASGTAHMVVSCIVRESGAIEDCDVLKADPQYLAAAFVARIQSQRCDPPATKDGVAVAIRYVFNVKMEFP